VILQQKIVHIPDLGEIPITRKKGCRRLNIRVNANEIKVSIPFRTSFGEGEKFLLEKLSWVKETSQRLSQNTHKKLVYNESSILFTQAGIIKIEKHQSDKYVISKKGFETYILVPNSVEFGEEKVQNEIKNLIIKYIRIEAKKYLPQRVLKLANIINVNYGKVRVKNATTRWGSCSYRNDINLNMKLLFLPEELSDYIIFHELSHVIHKNHGPKFWDFLDKIAGEAKLKAKKLKKFNISEMP
jgi:predicted metal-dependent hydrolase